MALPTFADPAPEPDVVLTKATVRVAEALGLTGAMLASILGISASTVSRFGRGVSIRVDRKEGELALLLIRLYRSLDGIVCGDTVAARAWIRADNLAIGGVPLERIRTVEGLVDVVVYLDAMRART